MPQLDPQMAGGSAGRGYVQQSAGADNVWPKPWPNASASQQGLRTAKAEHGRYTEG